MAGTGLPIKEAPPVLTDPSPLVQPTAASAAADMWGRAADLGASGMRLALTMDEAAHTAYRADLEQRATDEILKLYSEHPDDPEAFKGAVGAYRDSTLKGVDLRFADDARRIINHIGTAKLGQVTNAWIAKTQQQNLDRIDSRMKGLADEALGHAGAGDMASFGQSFDNFANYADEKAKLGFWSQEHADRSKDSLTAGAKAQSALRSIATVWRTEGPNAALAHADEVAGDANIPFSAAERDHFRQRAHALVNDLDARKARDDATTAQAQATTYARDYAGWTKSAIDGTLTETQLLDLYRNSRVEPADFITLYRSVRKNAEDAQATAEAIQRVEGAGRQAPLADRIIGAEWSPKGPDQNPNSSAAGPGQFIDSTWIATVRKAAPELAAGKTDAQLLALRDSGTPQERRVLHARMVDGLASENRAYLAGKGLPTDDGALYLAHFAGAGGAEAILSADQGTPVRDLLSADAIRANAGMKRGGKAFADWTAADLRAWAADKVTTGPAAVRYLDPRSSDDRNAASLHFKAIMRGLDQQGASPADRQDATLAAITKYGFLPDEVAGDIRGKLRNGDPAQKVETARFVSRIEARAPQVARDLSSEDYTAAHMLNDQLDAGVAPDIAVQRVDAAMRQDPAELERRKQAYTGKKTEDANRSWLTKQGRHWISANAAIPDALAGEFEDLTRSAFLATGNLDVARKVAWNDLSKVWAETGIGGKRFARYAPEAMYANGRDSSWIEGQLYHDLEQAGTAAPAGNLKGRIRLEADRTTRHEDKPSYQVLEQDDNGVWGPIRGKDGKPLLGPDGKPMRWRPDWNSSPAADDERRGIAQTVDRARVLRDFRDLKSEIPGNTTAGLFNPR